MKVLVCGSRDWTDPTPIAARLSALPGEHEEITILHGGAPGADTVAAMVAEDFFGFTVRAFFADWRKHGRRAGPIRNRAMLDEEPDLVIAFRSHGASPGTDDTVREARKRSIPVEVHTA